MARRRRSPKPRRYWKPGRRPIVRVKTDPFEFRTWVAIKKWCHDPGDERYPRYGGRGVAVCERWLDSFANFVQDMGGYGTRPRGTVLARIDHTGPFSPANCYWKLKRKS